VETIYGVGFKLLEGDVFCWRTIISAFEGTEDNSASRCRAEQNMGLPYRLSQWGYFRFE
jgi:hypothetical protein